MSEESESKLIAEAEALADEAIEKAEEAKSYADDLDLQMAPTDEEVTNYVETFSKEKSAIPPLDAILEPVVTEEDPSLEELEAEESEKPSLALDAEEPEQPLVEVTQASENSAAQGESEEPDSKEIPEHFAPSQDTVASRDPEPSQLGEDMATPLFIQSVDSKPDVVEEAVPLDGEPGPALLVQEEPQLLNQPDSNPPDIEEPDPEHASELPNDKELMPGDPVVVAIDQLDPESPQAHDVNEMEPSLSKEVTETTEEVTETPMDAPEVPEVSVIVTEAPVEISKSSVETSEEHVNDNEASHVVNESAVDSVNAPVEISKTVDEVPEESFIATETSHTAQESPVEVSQERTEQEISRVDLEEGGEKVTASSLQEEDVSTMPEQTLMERADACSEPEKLPAETAGSSDVLTEEIADEYPDIGEAPTDEVNLHKIKAIEKVEEQYALEALKRKQEEEEEAQRLAKEVAEFVARKEAEASAKVEAEKRSLELAENEIIPIDEARADGVTAPLSPGGKARSTIEEDMELKAQERANLDCGCIIL